MNYGISKVTIYVDDQKQALDFWTKKMGCDITTDLAYSDDIRWLEVTPPGGGARLVLHKRTAESPAPSPMGHALFSTPDIKATCAELADRGVTFTQSPVQESWGWSAVFTDNEGNHFHISQEPN
ncbi:VOC family protein [Sinosporangium siamense]|uniref:Glyoxalase n=1 Tax=Sinosporangium siamense TaxID=1367973 RepID=A0A919RK73_9ACTN|nr:VOC family protein [Sinosporangium siamense]GII93884.1 glyoxalase [Sinosporangium siamense]